MGLIHVSIDALDAVEAYERPFSHHFGFTGQNKSDIIFATGQQVSVSDEWTKNLSYSQL